MWAEPGPPQRGSGARAKAPDGAARLNIAIINRLRMGVDLHRLAAPKIGSSVAIEVMEGLLIGQLLDGTSREPDALIDGVLNECDAVWPILAARWQAIGRTRPRTACWSARRYAACWRGACRYCAAWG